MVWENLKSGRSSSGITGPGTSSTVDYIAKGLPKKWTLSPATRLLGQNFIDKVQSSVEQLSAFFNEDSTAEQQWVRSILETKSQSYFRQDLHSFSKQGLYEKPEGPMSVEDIIVVLQKGKWSCEYCQRAVRIVYEYQYDECQWTLDRINNFLPHRMDNVLLTCLACNVQRRCQSRHDFKRRKRQFSSLFLQH